MARDGLHAPSRSVGFALAAYSPALLCEAGVLRREGMPSIAMGSGLFLGAARVAPKGEAAEVLSRLCGDNFGHGKTFCRAPHDRFGLPAARQHEFADEVACTVDDDPLCVAPIALAVLGGNPPTILRRVVPVNVNAVNHEAIWARPHVGNEGVEVVTPPLANADTSSPIVLEDLCSRVPASVPHVHPCVEKGVRVLERHGGYPCEKYTSTKWKGKTK